MEDDVALVDELAHDRGREHGVDDEVKIRPFPELLDVAVGAGRQIVQGEDLPALAEQMLREMGADEAGPAGDQGLGRHRASLTTRPVVPVPRLGDASSGAPLGTLDAARQRTYGDEERREGGLSEFVRTLY
jgi:hypothetical protein